MFMKDRHTGAGREGSGRVSAFKATGLLYSYTLECNFNTGRLVNGMPMASRDSGRATPPIKLDHPPKYDAEIYEDSGKAMAIAILDLTESNPWTRLTSSAHKNLRGVRDWLKKYIKAKAEEEQEKAAAKNSPSKSQSNGAVASPGRSLRSSARRVRTFSSSSSNSAKKKSKSVANSGEKMASPESYRPMSKIARKNSLQQSQTPRGRMKSLESGTSSSSSSVQRSLSSNSAKRRPSTAVAVMRGRSQSVVMSKSPSMTSRPGSPPTTTTTSTTTSRISTSRSRPTSPTTKRPPSRADVLNIKSAKKKTKARKLSGTVRKSSCVVVGSLDTTVANTSNNGEDHQQHQQVQASSSSTPIKKKKKPVKRIIQ
jgi:hypothetical protein